MIPTQEQRDAIDKLSANFCATQPNSLAGTITINGLGGNKTLSADEFLVWLDGFLDGREELNEAGIERIKEKLRWIHKTVSVNPITFPSHDPFIYQSQPWTLDRGPTCGTVDCQVKTNEDILEKPLRK